jgi:hypothetical protein
VEFLTVKRCRDKASGAGEAELPNVREEELKTSAKPSHPQAFSKVKRGRIEQFGAHLIYLFAGVPMNHGGL